MVVSQAPPQPAPTATECEHPAPVTGIMAHEFAPYRGAEGPEGARRTTTYYGPVLGGLPIQAWHCPDCGLLKLSHPDGRREERRLFPGPQPGLLALPTPADTPHAFHGRQPRVSGLSAEPAFFDQFAAEPAPPLHRQIGDRLPSYGAVTWTTLIALVLVAAGLLLAGYLAVYDYQTPASEGPLVEMIAALFAGVFVLQILAALGRHLLPPGSLPPSVAVASRGRPELDGPTRAALTLLVLAIIGLLLGGYLAVYDYQTSTIEAPVVIATLACGAGAIIIPVAGAIRRHLDRS